MLYTGGGASNTGCALSRLKTRSQQNSEHVHPLPALYQRGVVSSAAIFESNPLERAIRDVQAAAKHVAMSSSSFAIAGGLRLGLDPGTTRF